jgi:peptide/nickel transport system permease protein
MTTQAHTAQLEVLRPSRGLWRDAMHRFVRTPSAMVGLALVLGFVIMAVFAPWLAPYDPREASLIDTLAPPSAEHPLGQDLQGRDELSRIIWGARNSLQIGVISVTIGVAIGIVVGSLAGFVGGWADSILMRLIDMMLAIPGLLFAIAIVAVLGPGLYQIMLAIGIVNVPIFARLLRASILHLKTTDFALSARAIGASGPRILLAHLLPNALTPLIVQATLAVATAVIDAAGLGFLGLGPQDPRTAEWGTMLADAPLYLARAPHLAIFPGVAIVLSVLGFNLLGDGLRESLDPRLRR